MKSLVLVVILTTLVSCNKSSGSGSKSNGPIKEKIQDALSALVRGQSSNELRRGLKRSYEFETETIRSIQEIESTITVILKIEGTNVYNYEVRTNQIEHTERRSVNLTDYNYKEIDIMLKSGKAVLEGDVLRFDLPFEIEWNMQSTAVKEKGNLIGTVNLAKPLCETSNVYTTSGTMVKDGRTTILPKISSTTVETCGRILSVEELKAIDLRSIEFCDDTKENDDVICESNVNMSFLTADL